MWNKKRNNIVFYGSPEKIYLRKNLLGELCDSWDAQPSEVFTNFEYIRTDAFIEKAKEFIYSALNAGIMGTANIEDFMRLFKNYMKGE